MRIKYPNDIREFTLDISSNRFTLRRQPSSLPHFIEWYLAFMPNIKTIFESFRNEIQTITGQPVTPVQTDFQFNFILTRFSRPGWENRSQRNLEVLQGLIPELPDSSGASLKLADHPLYRIDLELSKREAISGKVRNTWYKVEAPFNDGGKMLECTFTLRSQAAEQLIDGIGTLSYDIESIDDHDLALMGFLKERALEGLLGSLLTNWNFTSVTSLAGV